MGKVTKVKRIGRMAVAVLMMGIASSWLTPCSGMDALTQTELGDMSGQVGFNIAIDSPVTVELSFQSISYGDTDGWGTTGADNPGWVSLIGTGSNWGYISNTLPECTEITADVATTGAGGCNFGGVRIPANTSFFTFTLSQTEIGLVNPTTVFVCATDDATKNPGSGAGYMDYVGWMKPDGLAIELDSSDARCYIWAH